MHIRLLVVGILWAGVTGRAQSQIQEITSPQSTITIKTQDGLRALIDIAVPLTLKASGNAIVAKSDNGNGVFGESGNVAVYAHNSTTGSTAYLGANCCAGDFRGNVNVVGTLTKTAGSFKIDHPLDPGGKYLSHSFVESPDMMNVYNGNTTLDEHGRATVELPAWFEALNGEYRYQLTPLRAPAPNLYIAQEISHNRFVIAGGPPAGRVSWQVTGIRHDAYANAHRISVEEEKPKNERGTYLYPGLAGKQPQASLQLARYPEVHPVLVSHEAKRIPALEVTRDVEMSDGR